MSELLQIDPAAFSRAFAREPLRVEHKLTEHQLLTVESVADLADELPETSVEHNRGDIDRVLADGRAPRLEQSPGKIAREIETNGCWMVLKNIEQVSRYNDLLNELLDEVTPLVRGSEGGMSLREGYIFLTSPNSTTPAHTDHEHNFLLQVRSEKLITIGKLHDRLEFQKQAERMYSGHRNMDRTPDDPEAFTLNPGEGVYVPPIAPHWVETKDDVSVSLSITFQTPTTLRASKVHAINRHLRRVGLKPAAPGRRPGMDRAKAQVFEFSHRLRGR